MKLLLIGVLSFSNNLLFAQDSTFKFNQLFPKDTNTRTPYPQINEDKFRSIYQSMFSREFERILTGSNTAFGNFGTLSTTDDLLQLNGMIPLWRNSSLALNINGGVTEGIATLIREGETSPKVGAKLTLNIGHFSERSTFTVDGTQFHSFLNSIEEKQIETTKKRNEIELELASKLLEKAKAEYAADSAKKELELLRPILNADSTNYAQNKSDENKLALDKSRLTEAKFVLDTLKYLIMDSLYKREIKYLVDSNARTSRAQQLEELKITHYKSLRDKLILKSYKISWFSISAEIKNRAFKSFADSLTYGNQFTSHSFNQFKIEGRWNHFVKKDSKCGSYFLSTGIAYSLDDNFTDLEKVKIDDVEAVGGNQTMKSSTTAYIGDYQLNLQNVSLFADFYLFLNKSRTFAFHLNPTVIGQLNDFRDKTYLNSRFGLLFEFQKPKKDGVFNAELFYDISSIGAKLKVNERFDDRTILGVNLNIPIHFNQQK